MLGNEVRRRGRILSRLLTRFVLAERCSNCHVLARVLRLEFMAFCSDLEEKCYPVRTDDAKCFYKETGQLDSRKEGTIYKKDSTIEESEYLNRVWLLISKTNNYLLRGYFPESPSDAQVSSWKCETTNKCE